MASPQPEQPELIAGKFRVLLVIPTFNNRGTLRRVAQEALAVGPPVLVVNDGSTDGGPDLLAGLPLERLDLSVNQGKGAAILAAARWAHERDFTHLITLDADGQHEPGEAPRFVQAIASEPWAIIVGAREMSGADVPRSSRFGRAFSNFWLKIAAGASLPDSQSGFRAYPVAALLQIPCFSRRYDFEVEILVRAAWAGLSLGSVAVSTHYAPGGGRVSHFRPVLDNLRISRTYARLVLRNFIPWPHKMLPAPAAGSSLRLSLRDPWRSLKILANENTSPKEIGAASMLGIFLGALPLIACHGIVIVFFATRLRLNRLIALNSQHLCAPPLVPALALEVGHFVCHHRFLTELSWRTLGHEAPQRLFEYLIGALLIGPLLALVFGSLIYLLALAWQRGGPGGSEESIG